MLRREGIAGDLALALDAVRLDMAPAPLPHLMAAVSRVAGLLCGDFTKERRDEFIEIVLEDLEHLPGAIVLDALRRARGTINAARLLLPWILTDVERRVALLRRQSELLERLGALVG